MGRKAISTSNLRQQQHHQRQDNGGREETSVRRRLSDRHDIGGGGGRTNAQVRASLKGKSESFFKSLDARELIKEKENENKQQRMLIEIPQIKQTAVASAGVVPSFDEDEMEDEDTSVIRVGNGSGDGNKKRPAVIVTGLSNVKIRGDKIQVTKQFQKTIHNENAVIEIDKRSGGVSRSVNNESKLSYSSQHQQPIRIKIDNDTPVVVDRTTRRPPQIKYTSTDVEMEDDDEATPTATSGVQSTVTLVNNNKKQPVVSSQIYDPHGYRLQVSNLHPRVTEDDIRELFGDIGPVKRARFLDKGIVEVVYVRLDDAKQAIAKYHKSELDGRAMIIELLDGGSNTSNSSSSSKSRASYSTSHNSESSGNGSSSASHRLDYKKTIYSNGGNHQHHSSSSSSNGRANYSSTSPASSSTTLKSRIEQPSSSSSTSSSNSTLPALTGSTLSDKFKSLTNEVFVLPESVVAMANKNPSNRLDRIDPALVTQTLFNPSSSSSGTTFTVKI